MQLCCYSAAPLSDFSLLLYRFAQAVAVLAAHHYPELQSAMGPNRSGYQVLSQSVEDVDDSFEGDLSVSSDILPAPVTAGPPRNRRLRSNAPKSIDLRKLDVAFKR